MHWEPPWALLQLTEAQGFCTNATPYGAARRWTVPPRLFFSFVEGSGGPDTPQLNWGSLGGRSPPGLTGGTPPYQSGPPQTVRAGLSCSTWVGLDCKDFQDWTSRLDFWTFWLDFWTSSLVFLDFGWHFWGICRPKTECSHGFYQILFLASILHSFLMIVWGFSILQIL